MRTEQFPSSSSLNAGRLARFREQMADHLARGPKLHDLRIDRHESQEYVAGQIHRSTKSVRGWEKGKPIKWENAQLIAGYYDVNPELIAVRKDKVEHEIERALNGEASEEDPTDSEPDPQAEQFKEIHEKLDEILDLLHQAEEDTATEDDDASDVPDSLQP